MAAVAMTAAAPAVAADDAAALAPAPPVAADNFEFRVDGSMPYLAFDKLEKTSIDVPGGQLAVGMPSGEFQIGKQKVLDWVERSAKAVSVYYGRFPVASARVLIVPGDGAEPLGGQAFGNAGAAVRLMVGRDVTEDALARDWQMPHEMVHLTFPSVPMGAWLTEGLAVYVEPIARAQAGDLTEAYIWGDFAKMLPTGLPKKGDKGLDKAEEKERIYQGGAMFWLMADLEIRKRTQNRAGVQDALRGVLASGGTIEEVWPAGRALAVADNATGQTVLTEFYEKWRARPVSPDLDSLWRDLGVKISGGDVRLDDDAPLAAVRKAITVRRAESVGESEKPR